MGRKPENLIGNRYGRLVVVEKAEDYVTPKSRQKQWLCKCDCGNEIIVKAPYLKTGKAEDKSCGCLKEEKRDKRIAENTKGKVDLLLGDDPNYKEKANELFDYVIYTVLGRDRNDKNQNIKKQEILRLLGIRHGTYIDSSKLKHDVDYPIEAVINTFKICNPSIQRAFMSKQIEDDSYKLNYAIKVVNNRIHDVYMRMLNAKREKEEVKNKDVSYLFNDGAKYQRKTEDNKAFERFKHLM